MQIWGEIQCYRHTSKYHTSIFSNYALLFLENLILSIDTISVRL